MSNQEEDFVETTELLIREKITHVLTIWPKISPSMLQVGIGTAISPKMWHPVFEQMLAEGLITRNEQYGRGPSGRDQTFITISLAEPKAE